MDQDVANQIRSAIRVNDLDKVRTLLTEYPAMIKLEQPGPTWMDVALDAPVAAAGRTDMLHLLITLGCDVNESMFQDGTLSRVISRGKLEVLRCLLEHGANPNMGNPLILAIRREGRNSLEFVKLLQQHGADIHRCFPLGTDGKLMNALSLATIHKKQDVVEFLQSLGAHPPAEASRLERQAPTKKPGRSQRSGAFWKSVMAIAAAGNTASSMPEHDLKSPFDQIYRSLIAAIPDVIESFTYPEPLCLVRVYYYDSHAPSTYLDFRCVSVRERQEVLKKQQHKPSGPLYYLWAAGEECGTSLPATIPENPESSSGILAGWNLYSMNPDKQIKGLFAEVNSLLDQDSNLYMTEFRKTLQRVTLKLNELDWKQICEVSDDFVIIPADGSRFFGRDEDDIEQGMPAERLKLLQSRGFLGPPESLLRS